jgi:hypothetical protein
MHACVRLNTVRAGELNLRPFTIFVAPAGEQLAPGFGAVDAEVELTANASTKTVDAKIVANRFTRFLNPGNNLVAKESAGGFFVKFDD